MAPLEIIRKELFYMKQMIFVCSPYRGDIETNTELARRYCRHVVDKGFIPIAPHLLFPQFMDDNNSEERELAIEMNLGILQRCSELWVFGRSPSACGRKSRRRRSLKFLFTMSVQRRFKNAGFTNCLWQQLLRQEMVK
jgi:hypothetical protein